jgi:hypothetical protein
MKRTYSLLYVLESGGYSRTFENQTNTAATPTIQTKQTYTLVHASGKIGFQAIVSFFFCVNCHSCQAGNFRAKREPNTINPAEQLVTITVCTSLAFFPTTLKFDDDSLK